MKVVISLIVLFQALLIANEIQPNLNLIYKLYLKNPLIYKQQIASEGNEIFIKRCSHCHGQDGSGQGRFAADLRTRISKESVYFAIKNGANNFKKDFPGGMPPMVKDDEKAKILSEYISLGMPSSHAGSELYKQTNCARCHGEDGYGKKYLAPNIKNFDKRTIISVLKSSKQGKIGFMPGFNYLSDEELEIIALYVLSLSN